MAHRLSRMGIIRIAAWHRGKSKRGGILTVGLRGAKVTLRGVAVFAHPLELRMELNYDSSLNDERSSVCIAMLMGVDVGSYMS